MKKFRVPFPAVVVVVAAAALALIGLFGHFFTSFESKAAPPESKAASSCCMNVVPKQATPVPRAVPEHVPYMFLFHHLAVIRGTSAEREFQAKSGLTDQEFAILSAIALDNETEVAAVDQRAQVVIDAFHLQYPPGKLPPGIAPPAPPTELNGLQTERDNTHLRNRDRLRVALGDGAFARLQAFVASDIVPNVSIR